MGAAPTPSASPPRAPSASRTSGLSKKKTPSSSSKQQLNLKNCSFFSFSASFFTPEESGVLFLLQEKLKKNIRATHDCCSLKRRTKKTYSFTLLSVYRCLEYDL